MSKDLFADSTMSLGEHLEELRGSLSRALVGLVIGFLIALLFAKHVVRLIETPLSRALAKYQIAEARDRLGREPTAADLYRLNERNLIPEHVFVDPSWPGIASDASPEGEPLTDPESSDSARDNGKLVEMTIWRPVDTRTQSLNAHEPFMIYIKAAVVSGILLASPWIFFQIWQFVAVGLYPHERNYVYVFLPLSLGLFFLGALLAFCFVFEPVLDFLFGFNRAMNIDAKPRITEWLSFVLMLPLGFGISFQLPLVMLLLERLGIVSVDVYLKNWRIAVLGIFVISMFLTPADPISMLLMAVPLTILYFGGVALCRWLHVGRSPVGEMQEV